MHAIRSDPGGAPGAVKLETVPVPRPAAGQVLLRVYAAGTNPVERSASHVSLSRGRLGGDFCYAPGFEYAGMCARRKKNNAPVAIVEAASK